MGSPGLDSLQSGSEAEARVPLPGVEADTLATYLRLAPCGMGPWAIALLITPLITP